MAPRNASYGERSPERLAYVQRMIQSLSMTPEKPLSPARMRTRELALQRWQREEQRLLTAGTQSVAVASLGAATSQVVPVPSDLGAARSLAAGVDVPPWLLPTAAGVAGAAVVGTGVAYAVSRSKRSKRSKRKGGKSRSRPGKGGVVRGKKDRNRRGGAVRDRYKGRKVYRTKRGQPYILMANGKARFVRA